jgi:hypothetical protein
VSLTRPWRRRLVRRLKRGGYKTALAEEASAAFRFWYSDFAWSFGFRFGISLPFPENKRMLLGRMARPKC